MFNYGSMLYTRTLQEVSTAWNLVYSYLILSTFHTYDFLCCRGPCWGFRKIFLRRIVSRRKALATNFPLPFQGLYSPRDVILQTSDGFQLIERHSRLLMKKKNLTTWKRILHRDLLCVVELEIFKMNGTCRHKWEKYRGLVPAEFNHSWRIMKYFRV